MKRRLNSTVILALCSLVIGHWSLSSAHAVSPSFTATTPAGAQRGTELTVTLKGARLEDAQEIIFYSPGIEVVKLESIKADAVKAHLKIAPDCRLGEHQLRVRTASGVSDLRLFEVGSFREITEVEPNNEIGKAQKVLPNSTINGTAGGEDVDVFQVEAKQGERISAEVEAIRLARTMLDTWVAILDRDGKVLAASDDTTLLMQDSAVSVLAPATGSYFIQLRDTSYGGTEGSAYRLHIGNFPRPTGVFPAGGKAGETVTVKFLGDAGGEFTQDLKLPDKPSAKFGAYAERDGILAPSPNWLRVSEFPNVLESAVNHDRATATVTFLDLPLALNGIIAKDGEADWFRFPAKKDKAIDVNVYARRLRSPLDSVLEIQDATGRVLASNDDAAGPDSAVKFTPPADGDYFVRVTDHLGKGGADYVYRVELTYPHASYSVSIPQVARNESQARQYIIVPRGNRFATMLAVKRNNFSGDLTFSNEGLPKGVKIFADTLAGKLDQEPVVFEADSDASLGGKLLEFTGTPSKPAIGAFRHDLEFIAGPNQTYYYNTHAEKLYVAVVEAAPFKLSLVEPRVPLVQSGVMDLKVNVERLGTFNEPVNVKMMWNPPGVGSLPDLTIPKGSSSGAYQINASANAETRHWHIALLASAPLKGGTVFVSSQFANLEISPPYVTAPLVGSSRRLSRRIRDVLPAPDGPTSETTSPAGMSRSTSRSVCTSPRT